MAKRRITRKLTLTIEFVRYQVNMVFTADPAKYYNNTLLPEYPDLPNDLGGSIVAVHAADPEAYPRKSFIIFPLDCEAGVVLHELTHAVDNIIDYFGFEGTEIRAYLLEYLFNQTVYFLQSFQ